MNKRIWSIAIALAMLLSMVCSAFVVSAAETQAATQIEEEQAIIEEIELLQEAPLLAADAGALPSLKLSSTNPEIAVGGNVTVDLSLENYQNNWATFTVDLNYDIAAVEYLSCDKSKLPQGVTASVNEYSTGTLTIVFLSTDVANISATDLLSLSFKAIAASETNPFSATILEDTVAGYDSNGESVSFTTSSYNATATVDSYTITKKTPYLTIRLIETELDAEGKEIPVASIEQGKELYAIVTLNDYYDPWMTMTLSLNYDTSLFTYVETEGEDLDAFVSDANGKMTVIPAETDEEGEPPLSICFMSSDLSNRLLKNDAEGNAVTTADVLKLKFVVSASGDLKQDVNTTIGTSFVSDGNLKSDPEAPMGTVEMSPTEDFKVEAETNGAASITIETIERPYLTLNVLDSAGASLGAISNLKIEKGDSFTVQVKINNFTQQWSMMSLFAQFDSDVFEIPGGKSAVTKGVFGDYMIPVLMDNTLGATLLNTSGADTGLTNGATEGIILEIPLKVKEDATYSGSIEPFKVFFDTEGNYSGGELLGGEFYDSKQDAPATIAIKAQGQPLVKMEAAAVGEADLNNLVAGDQVQFKVSVDNFIGEWSAMTLQVNFNSNVFELVPDANGKVATNSNPFDTSKDTNSYSTFMPSAGGGYLLACWFNGVDLPMNNGESQEVMTFTLKVKDGYYVSADELEQAISVEFDPEGNYSEGNLLTGSTTLGEGDFISTPFEVNVTVEQSEGPLYEVKITWEGAMEFTYDFGTWDPTNHVWKDRGWKCVKDGVAANWIEVTNLGTDAITATFEFINDENVDWIQGKFYEDANDSSEAGASKVVQVETSAPKTVYFDPVGDPVAPVTVGEEVTLGTIKVTIASVDNQE